MSDPLEQFGVSIKHHFSSGVYAKETRIPSGVVLTQHIHCYDHLSILSEGVAKVFIEGVESIKSAPCCIEIKANVEHKVEAITPVIWFCIHATNDNNPDTVDVSLMSKVIK